MPKKTTKEQIPEEPFVESSEGTSESLSPEEFEKQYLNLDELLYHLVTLHKFKRNTEEWIRETRQLVEDKVGMKEYKPESSSLIRKYLSDFTDLSFNLMKVVCKVSELTKCNK